MGSDNPIPNNHEDTSTFRILIATDIHLGFKHQDPVRGHDSMGTFEEVLQLAREHRVDFVLLGGDLFHENRPPRAVMHGCLQLLKNYCVGEEPQTFQVIDTERDEAGPCGTDVAVSTASFSESNTSLSTNKTKALLPSTSSSPDPLTPPASGFSVSSSFAETTTSSKPSNMNISMPVFSIHGNHDEPTGPLNLSAMDIVECAGLVHYFGKTTSVSEIEVKPVLLKKGSTQLALYGIGSIRSDKLHQMYVTKKVTMEPPQQDNAEDWFNILVLHQNRVQRAHQTHVKESFIHDFIDLAIWGHEHESLMKPTPVAEGRKTKILQPGSTIATQFKQSETKQKHAALLTVCGREFHLEPLRLQTVRKMFIVDLIPRVIHGETEDDEVNRLMQDCQNKVERLLERQRGPGEPHEPLICIKVQHEHFFYKTFSATRRMDERKQLHSGETIGMFQNPGRFGTPFVGRVANPHTIVVFGRKGSDPESDLSDLAQPHTSEFPMLTLEDLLLRELQKEDLPPQIVLKKKVLTAMRDYVHLEKSGAISTMVKEQLERVQKKLKSSDHLLSTTESLTDWIDEAIRTHREGIEGTPACAEEAAVSEAVAPAASAGEDEEDDSFRHAARSMNESSTAKREDSTATMNTQLIDDDFFNAPSFNRHYPSSPQKKSQTRANLQGSASSPARSDGLQARPTQILKKRSTIHALETSTDKGLKRYSTSESQAASPNKILKRSPTAGSFLPSPVPEHSSKAAPGVSNTSNGRSLATEFNTGTVKSRSSTPYRPNDIFRRLRSSPGQSKTPISISPVHTPSTNTTTSENAQSPDSKMTTSHLESNSLANSERVTLARNPSTQNATAVADTSTQDRQRGLALGSMSAESINSNSSRHPDVSFLASGQDSEDDDLYIYTG